MEEGADVKEKNIPAAPQLQFRDEDRQTVELIKPIEKVERAADKRDRMKARLRQEHSIKKKPVQAVQPGASERAAGEATAPPAATRLLFTDDTSVKPLKKHGQGIVSSMVNAEIDQQIAEDEDSNYGLQAIRTVDRAGQNTLHTVQNVHQSKLQHDRHRLEQAEKKLDHANVHFLQREQEIKNPEHTGSNPLSRAHQRRAIKKEYMAAKAGRSTGAAYGAKHNAQKAVKKASEATESVAAFMVKHKHFILIFALVALLMVLMNALSSCTPLLEAGLQALVMGTYPAEEDDVRAAERAYKSRENELIRELERYERYHPGYDEYIIEADTDDIWHDPYALIAIISAYHGGEEWAIDDVYGTIEMLFNWQYKVTETVRTETRYRLEGETRIPYVYRICTVTLEAKNLSHAPVYIMSREKMGLYALYMSTLGNMPDLFHGAHVSTLKEPLVYEVPQELLDADPKFALLVEEANKRLGYPYVWGGYDPSTSFDCSGFISWLFTTTGVNNIGHMGATTLYGYSEPVRPEDAKPGDVIFFQGTMGDDTAGITHCGLYVGNNMMVHCGNPCSYADLTESYWQEHFYGYGRLYDH